MGSPKRAGRVSTRRDKSDEPPVFLPPRDSPHQRGDPRINAEFIAPAIRQGVGGLTHPVFDYKVSYRRALELQLRMIAKVITGEIAI